MRTLPFQDYFLLVPGVRQITMDGAAMYTAKRIRQSGIIPVTKKQGQRLASLAGKDLCATKVGCFFVSFKIIYCNAFVILK